MNVFVIWRLTPLRHERTAFTGKGAALFGGRWNLPNVPLVYCAESRSLAALEVLANIRDPKIHFALPWVTIPADLPADLLETPDKLPENWQTNPYPLEAQRFGSEWAKAQRSVALRVPSTVIAGEFNYLLNPAHPQFSRVKIGKPLPFLFDPRLA